METNHAIISYDGFCEADSLAKDEICRGEINAKFGSNFESPVVYYCQLISVACDRSSQNTAIIDRNSRVKKLEEIAAK